MKNLKKRSILTILGIVVLSTCIALAIFFVYTNLKKDKSGQMLENSIKAQMGQLDGKNKAQIEEELNRIIEKGSMQISINLNPQFPSGSDEGNLKIENSPANHYAQEVVIFLNDDKNTEIYRSGLILPNYHIETDKLSVDLDKGEYPCTAIFTAYDTSTDTPLPVGTAAANLKIFVLS